MLRMRNNFKRVTLGVSKSFFFFFIYIVYYEFNDKNTFMVLNHIIFFYVGTIWENLWATLVMLDQGMVTKDKEIDAWNTTHDTLNISWDK